MAFALSEFKDYARISGNQDDSLITQLSSSAESVCKSILGLKDTDDLPDNDRVTQAQNLLTLHYFENRAFIGRALPEVVMKQATSLLSAYRDPAKFMPPVEDSA